MKIHLSKFCSAFSPSLLWFGFSGRRKLSEFGFWGCSFKVSLSSAVVFQLFDEIPHSSKSPPFNSLPTVANSLYGSPKTVVSGSAMSGNPCVRLQSLFSEQRYGKRPTKYVMCTALNSCARTLNWFLGVQMHGLIIKNGYENNLILNSALLDFYAKCGVLEDARRIFDGMKHHDHVSWTSMISGYGQSGCITKAILLFKEMLATNVKPNSFTYVSIISSCTALEAKLEQGTLFHAHVVKRGFDANSFVVSSLIDHYSKCGEIDIAASLFNLTVNRDDVLYNSIIYGYSQNLHWEKALKLFIKMRNSDLKPTDYTMSIILNACGNQAILSLGKQVHCLVIKLGSLSNLFVSSSLIDVYSKCGCINEARGVFDQTVEKNNVLWTSMLLGYAQNGRASEGLELFDQLMMEESFVPDHICFTAILTACNHAGLVDKGLDYFNKMRDCGLVPNLDQYACLIDLYGRKGHLVKAKQLMEAMSFSKNYVTLTSFLSSCKTYGALELGMEAANQLFSMQPYNAATYVKMACIYAEAGLWDKVADIRKVMEEKGRRKGEGWSWVEVDGA